MKLLFAMHLPVRGEGESSIQLNTSTLHLRLPMPRDNAQKPVHHACTHRQENMQSERLGEELQVEVRQVFRTGPGSMYSHGFDQAGLGVAEAVHPLPPSIDMAQSTATRVTGLTGKRLTGASVHTA